MGRLKFLLFITINSIASAQVTTEQLYNGASSYSMAGSDLALPAHSWSMFVNPAGLAEGDHTTAIFGLESLYGLSYFSHASAGVQFTLFGLGAFGLSIEDLATNYEGNSLSKETALALHHGLTLQADRTSTLRFGYSLKEELSNTVTHGIGFILSIVGAILIIINACIKNGSFVYVVSSVIFGLSLIVQLIDISLINNNI